MANKTQPTDQSLTIFLDQWVEQEWKREESRQLISSMQQWTGLPPILWGPSIIGFGRYQYTYASGHSGEAPLLGFSPRKSAFSLYVYTPGPITDSLLPSLGKFTMGKACIYVKKISDIDLGILERLCKATIEELEQRHSIVP